MEPKVNELWDWKLEVQAVDKWRAAHPNEDAPNLTKALITALGIIGALVTAYIGLR